VLRTPSCADFWDVNTVRVESEGLAADAMLAAADESLAYCKHRKLDIEDEATGAAAREFFAELGWMNEQLAVMRRVGPPPPVEHPVEEVSVAESRSLRAEWYQVWEGDREEKVRFSAEQEPIMARRGMRAFVVPGTGVATLAVGSDAVEIDGLYVTPSARGRGIGAALVAAALAAGGRDVAWIVADDEGLARPLYDRLGFETVWRPHSFVRLPF
jgi:ribosomal protein S18 acetylase RimI-like enzyme